jgi:hypothetical protein
LSILLGICFTPGDELRLTMTRMTPSWHFETHFTLEEANKLVPWLREMFWEIHALCGYTSDVWQTKTNGNGRHKKLAAELANLPPQKARAMAEERLLQIAQRGIIVRDWKRGLVDFPAVLDGEEVFLCYELADGEAILYYHGLEEGYAGRRRI